MTMETAVVRREWPGAVQRLLWMQGLMNASHFMTVPLLAFYMSSHLHFGAPALASVMSANLLCAQMLPVAAGAIADRMGSRRLITLGLLLRGAGFLGFCAFDSVVAWTVSAMFAGTGVACYEGGVYAQLGRQPRARLSRVFAANNQMLNLGAAVGPILGGLAAMLDVRMAFAASAVVFTTLGVITLWSRIDTNPSHARQPLLQGLKTAVTHRGLLRLILVALPWFFLFPQLYVAFPVYAAKLAGPYGASAVYVVNGVVGLLFLSLMKRWLVSTQAQALVKGAYLAASMAFASVCIVTGVAGFLLFIVVYTVIETILLPTFETLTATLAPQGCQGAFLGAFSAAGALGGGAGYYVGSWLILNRSSAETWLTFGAVGLLGVLLSLVLLRGLAVPPAPR
ncbi:MFS transporter [Pseudomonas sp. LP_7_YM]|uniref:MFS transporter n=1 Tax=Pseudomonas sp. LP_7_YM TaxID=2485137 RepID=UPI001061705E|nr:MFS transporter [Pseudomonas sp. LP_7_YM]TDV70298.1 MFS transporter [Pseudomonas sp. LP_7_YM]